MTDELLRLLLGVDEQGYRDRRRVDPDRELFVMPITFGRARLAIGPAGGERCFDDVW